MKNKIIAAMALSLSLCFMNSNATAQAKFPPPSSAQEISQGLGIGKVKISYNRPNVKERQVFGELVPYNKVWRTGANEATKITFEDEVEVGGSKLPAGTYTLFTIPNTDEWTIIFNKVVDQWGAYSYKESEDVLRFKVVPTKTVAPVETFVIQFEEVQSQSLALTISWENTKVSFPIKVNQQEKIVASINEAMKGEKKPYFQSALYYYANDLDIAKAVEWVKKADENNTKAPHIKYWKAKILLKSGDKAGAEKAAVEGIEIAEKSNNEEYVGLNKTVLDEIKAN